MPVRKYLTSERLGQVIRKVITPRKPLFADQTVVDQANGGSPAAN
jgi:hypothetical protein